MGVGSGNYFVLTEDMYGFHTYDTTYGRSPAIETASQNSDGTMTYTESGINIDDNEWAFDTQDTDNIGYWLNNDFLVNGNGNAGKLPDGIINNLVETEWRVEGMKSAVLGWTARQYYDDLKGEQTARGFAQSRRIEPYTVRGKVALMSATEYRQYQDIIGFVHSSDVWRGFMLRTPHAHINGSKTTDANGNEIPQKCSYVWGGVMVKNNGSNREASKERKMVMCVNDSPTTATMFVRPVMWLSKDFFKNVHCNVENLGKYPLLEVRKHGYDVLTGVYTSSEIETLKLYADAILYEDVTPVAESIEIKGDASIGKVLKAQYTYVRGSEDSHEGLDEAYSVYQWYYSDTPKGEKKAINAADELTLTLTEDLRDKYIWFSVTPKNYFQKNGVETFSDKVIKIRPNNGINVIFKDNNSTQINSIGNVTELTAELSYTASSDVIQNAYIIKYDTDNTLTLVDKMEFLDDFTASKSMSVTSGDTVKVIVLSNGEIPYSIYEIN